MGSLCVAKGLTFFKVESFCGCADLFESSLFVHTNLYRMLDTSSLIDENMAKKHLNAVKFYFQLVLKDHFLVSISQVA